MAHHQTATAPRLGLLLKPICRVAVWRDSGWWLGRVIAAGDGADPTPLNSLTQARALASVDSVVRDLIATVLDTGEDAFDIEVEYGPSVGGAESLDRKVACKSRRS